MEIDEVKKMSQREFISILCDSNKNAIIVSSLGTIAYDLKDIDHDHKVLIKGAMGAAVGCGLGIALHTDKQVIVIVGDGSFLMKMGTLSTVLWHKLPNLRIVIINNNSYKSCGGQGTNFCAIAKLLKNLPNIEVYDNVFS